MNLWERMTKREYRKQDGTKRFDCTHPDYTDAWVEVPGEWLLLHQAKYQDAYSAVVEDHGNFIAELAAALALVEEFHIPGLKDDLSNLSEISTTILAWLRDVVIADYMLSFVHDPKALSPSLIMSAKEELDLPGSDGENSTSDMEPSSSQEES